MPGTVQGIYQHHEDTTTSALNLEERELGYGSNEQIAALRTATGAYAYFPAMTSKPTGSYLFGANGVNNGMTAIGSIYYNNTNGLIVNNAVTFSGNVKIEKNNPAIYLTDSGSLGNVIYGDSPSATSGLSLLTIRSRWNGGYVAGIDFLSGDDTINKDDGIIKFKTSSASSSPTTALLINNDQTATFYGNTTIGGYVFSAGQVKATRTSANGYALVAYNSGTTTQPLGGLYETSSRDSEFYLFSVSGGTNVRVHSNGLSWFNGGNVGIGTRGPDSLLHVYHTPSGIASPLTNTLITAEAGTDAYISILTPGNAIGGILFGDASDNDVGQLTYNHLVNAMSFTVNTAEGMRLNSTGLGIKTSSPSEALSVVGSVNVTGAGTFGTMISANLHLGSLSYFKNTGESIIANNYGTTDYSNISSDSGKVTLYNNGTEDFLLSINGYSPSKNTIIKLWNGTVNYDYNSYIQFGWNSIGSTFQLSAYDEDLDGLSSAPFDIKCSNINSSSLTCTGTVDAGGYFLGGQSLIRQGSSWEAGQIIQSPYVLRLIGTKLTGSADIRIEGTVDATKGPMYSSGILFGTDKLSTYTNGTFIGTWSGFDVSTYSTCYYTMIGNQVTVALTGASGTSSTTDFAVTNLPSEIRPTSPINAGLSFTTGARNSSGNTIAYGSLTSGGTITIGDSFSNRTWDSSGTRYMDSTSFTYLV